MLLKISVASAAVLSIAAVAYWASPYYVVRQCAAAASSADLKIINWCTDYPALRASLKKELRSQMLEQLRQAKPGDEFSAMIAAALAPKAIDVAVDAYVTPQGVAKLFERHWQDLQSFDMDSAGFESLSRFAVSSKGTVYVFSFEALRWKLTDVKFPPDNASAPDSGGRQ